MSSAKKSRNEQEVHKDRSLIYTKKRRGPRILPRGTPERTGSGADKQLLILTD